MVVRKGGRRVGADARRAAAPERAMDGRTARAGGNRKRPQEAAATTLAELSPMVVTLCGVPGFSQGRHRRRSAPSLRNPAPRKIKERGTPLSRDPAAAAVFFYPFFLPDIRTFFLVFLVILNCDFTIFYA